MAVSSLVIMRLYCKLPQGGMGRRWWGVKLVDMLACLFDVSNPPCEYNHVTHTIQAYSIYSIKFYLFIYFPRAMAGTR